MSVLIKGMEMPKDCNKCPMTVEGYCRIIGYPNGDAINKRYKPLWCPLVEVPKHRRLIDADELTELCDIMADKCGGIGESIWGQFKATVEWSPTIIEAEE